MPEFTHSYKQQVLGSIRDSEAVQKILAKIPENFKQNLKQIFPKHQPAIQAARTVGDKPRPVVTEMMAILQQSQYQLPFDKANQLIGYAPIVSFEEGCRRSIDWLAKVKEKSSKSFAKTGLVGSIQNARCCPHDGSGESK